MFGKFRIKPLDRSETLKKQFITLWRLSVGSHETCNTKKYDNDYYLLPVSEQNAQKYHFSGQAWMLVLRCEYQMS